MVDFKALQNVYNQQMDSLLAQTGLTTECLLTFGITKKDICPNCIFDVNLKKSANKYKNGGPIPFSLGQLCPYCNGIGYYGESTSETAYLAIIWDYKKWINPPTFNTAIPDGLIQTISNKSYLSSIRRCKNLEVIYPSSENQHKKFQLYSEPNPAGLGDNNYITCLWEKIN